MDPEPNQLEIHPCVPLFFFRSALYCIKSNSKRSIQSRMLYSLRIAQPIFCLTCCVASITVCLAKAIARGDDSDMGTKLRKVAASEGGYVRGL